MPHNHKRTPASRQAQKQRWRIRKRAARQVQKHIARLQRAVLSFRSGALAKPQPPVPQLRHWRIDADVLYTYHACLEHDVMPTEEDSECEDGHGDFSYVMV